MSKTKTSSPNLFGDFKVPEKNTPLTQETSAVKNTPKKEEEVAKPKESPKKEEPKEKETEEVKEKVEEKRRRGRPKGEYERDMKYVDVSGFDEYITIRAKQEKMYISEFLRYLVLKDAKEHNDLYNLFVDKEDQRVVKDLKKFNL